MGAPNYELIPAAVLLENPGLTRDEFIHELDQTHSSYVHHCDVSDSWGEYGGKRESDINHRGIFGLAHVLNLDRTTYRTKMEQLMSDTDVHVSAESFTVKGKKKDGKWVEPDYIFKLHSAHEMKVRQPYLYMPGDRPYKRGDICFDMAGRNIYVDKVLRVHGPYPVSTRDTEPPYHTDILGREIGEVYSEEIYSSYAELIKKRPDVDPFKMYNFEQERGHFAGFPNDAPWLQTDGKYFLDTQKLWNEKRETLYTSIFITAEAIRLKAWNLLCYDGGRNVQRFFADFPEAQQRHADAAMSWWVTHLAQNEQLTQTEYMHLLQEMRLHVSLSPDVQAMLSAQAIEGEGFTNDGRYLMISSKNQFTDDERSELARRIKKGRGATSWLRWYIKNQSQTGYLIDKIPQDLVPF